MSTLVLAPQSTARSAIIGEMNVIAKEQAKPLSAFEDETSLLMIGFDSLCFAILVARLEDRFGYDPFSELDDSQLPTTFGDFVQLYDRKRIYQE